MYKFIFKGEAPVHLKNAILALYKNSIMETN